MLCVEASRWRKQGLETTHRLPAASWRGCVHGKQWQAATIEAQAVRLTCAEALQPKVVDEAPLAHALTHPLQQRLVVRLHVAQHHLRRATRSVSMLLPPLARRLKSVSEYACCPGALPRGLGSRCTCMCMHT
jgi:hypothetical protein